MPYDDKRVPLLPVPDHGNLPLRSMHDDDERPPPRVPTEIKLVLMILISLGLAAYLNTLLNPAKETQREPSTSPISALVRAP